MSRPQAPRGTRDLLPAERAVFLRLEAVARDLTTRYGYQAIETPLFEQAEVFERGVGAVTDVVEKELVRVQAGRGEAERERWALRPEPTAGIVRAYVQHGMQTLPQPVKLTLVGPMFRYDRPQAGRYRQFWQFDVEALGDPGPAIDAEIIELAARFYIEAGLQGVELRLNSIGDRACRPAYIESLRGYFEPLAGRLPELERQRLATAPLRLLDSKDPVMQPLIADAPLISDHLCDACRTHFEGVQRHLAAVGVPVRLEPRLVRGLDYYTRTTFEFYPTGRDGQQDALGGGGRYDGLVELLGGKPTPGIGFGLGLDRVANALATAGVTTEVPHVPVVVVGADPADTVTRLEVATRLRAAGVAARAELGERKLGRQLESAAKEGAHLAVIVGDELASGLVQVRDLQAGTQRPVAVAELAREVARTQLQHRHGAGER
ncbi:MAG: histidine--tRNA ligase [Candidatus Limnocylindrales bacterium]